MAIELLDETIPEGSAKWVELNVTNDLDMSPLSVHLHVINGEADGPTLWLQGNIHGNEQAGGLAFRDFMLELSPEDVSGTIIGAPVVNPTAFRNKQRTDPIGEDQFGTNDVNRAFPGTEGGSYPQALAHRVFTTAEDGIDYFIGSHSTTGEITMYPGFTVVLETGDEVYDESVELATASDIPYLLEFDSGDIQGSMYEQLAERGVVAILFETGDSSLIEHEAYDTAYKAIKNAAKHLDMIAGEPVRENEISHHKGQYFLTAREGGFFESFIESEDEVTEGQRIGEITNIKGETVDTFEAPFDGVMVQFRTFPTARPGDPVFSIFPEEGVDGMTNIE